MFHTRNRYLDPASEDEPEDPLSKLIEGQGNWTLSTVSALYDLKHTPAKLKQYASKIKKILSCSISETKTTKYNVTIECDEDLRKGERDPYALSIIVRTTRNNRAEITSYVAILMSWGVNEEVPLGTHLPYLLERGNQQIGDAVKMMLAKLFDCCIAPMHITEGLMVHFAIKFCEMDPSVSKQIKFFYKLPDMTKGAITLTIDIQGLITIYDGVVNSLEDATPEEIVEGVYVGLQRHLFSRCKIDICMLELCKVSHPGASVAVSGAISAKNSQMLNFMLTYFNDTLLKRGDL